MFAGLTEIKMRKSTHPTEIFKIYERILKGSPAKGRFIELGAGHKIHILQSGTGSSLVYLHGGGAAAHTAVPMLEHLDGVRMIVPDRPGYGLSDPINAGRKSYRDMAVEVTDKILSAMRLEKISLAGSSGGGVWALWYALTYPERVDRLILLGSAPLLPGTYAPVPLRIMAAPVIGNMISRIPTNERMIVKMMRMVGEEETIVNHPMMIEALAAGSNDPVASKAARMEYAAFLNPLGFRSKMKIKTDDLAKLKMPTLVIWGKHDPLGGLDVARSVSEAIPNCVLELLPAGHVPFLGYPDKAAKLMLDFVLPG